MSAEDLVRGRDAIAAWQRLTYGWMGRSPDYKAAFLATYGPNADYYAPFEENARRWYKESQEKVIFINHTLVNPPVDRNRDIHEVDDIFIHAVKETDAGVVVRGAKMVATGSAFSNYNFVSYHGSAADQEEGVRDLLLRADGPAGHQADLPALVRVHGGDASGARSTTRSRAASTRTTPCSCSRTR